MSDFESYLRSAAPQAAPPPDDFSAFLERMKNAPVMNAQAISVANSQQSASNAAQAAKLAPQIGIPQSAVETDVPRFQQQALAQKNSAILAQNPVLTQWVNANPDSARVAQDEYDHLSTIEKAWQGTKGIGYEFLKALGGGWNTAALGLNRGLQFPADVVGAGDWWLKNMVEPLADKESTFAQEPDANIGKMAAHTAGSLLSMLAQVTLTGGNGEAAAATEGVLGTLANAGTQATRSMAFPAVTASVNTAHDVYAQTNDPYAAARAAMATYAFTTLQGAVPFSAPGSIPSRLFTGALSGSVVSEGQRAAMNLLLPPTLNRPFDPQEFVFNALFGAVLGAAMGPRGEDDFHQAIRQTYTDALNAEQALSAQKRLGIFSEQSTLKDANPEAFKEFVRTVTDGSDLSAVYIDPQKLGEAFAQSKVEPTPDMVAQMRDPAVNTVKIPVSDYATHIAGTDVESKIMPDLRAAPDGMTFSEGEKFFANAKTEMQTRAEQLAQQKQIQTEWNNDKKTVYQNVYDQLVAIGRDPGEAKVNATLAAEFYSAQAKREGMKPSELFAQSPLNIASEGEGLNQSAFHGTPHRGIEKFSTDKIGTGEGAQAYGWGLYFASKREIAEHYRKSLSDASTHATFYLNGEKVAPDTPERHAASLLYHNGKTEIKAAAKRWLADAKKGGDLGLEDTAQKAGMSAPEYWQRLYDFVNAHSKKEITTERGQLYEVELPDDEHLLNWDKPLSEQPVAVREALKNVAPPKIEDGMALAGGGRLRIEPDEDFGPRYFLEFDSGSKFKLSEADVRRLVGDGKEGKSIYQSLVTELGSDKAASEALAAAGIKGIKYLDGTSRGQGEGSHNYVIFSGDDVAIKNQFYQAERGAFEPSTRTVALLKDADLSTFIHESGHAFLDTLSRLQSEGAKQDFATLLKWFGVKDAETWHAMTLEQQRESHEKFAKGFERYLMEGKAPTQELQSLFGKVRAWMLSVYKSITGLGAELTPEVRQVMDRLIATDDAIQQAEKIRSYAPLFGNAKEAGMTTAQWNDYLAEGQKATDAAIGQMQSRSLADMKWLSNAKSKALRALQRQAAAARKEVRAQVENEVSAYPAFQAQDYMREHGGTIDVEELKKWTDARTTAEKQARDEAKANLYASNPEAKGLQKGQLLAKNKKVIEAQVGVKMAEWDKTNPKPKATGGPDVDIVANSFGFESGDAMRQAVMEAGNKNEIIDLMTDHRMLVEHGDLVDPQSVEMAANEAVHNEARARFMATGLKALTKSPLPPGQIARAAKEVAESTISGMTIGDLDVQRYLAAESKANKDAIAAAPKDPAKAIEFQRQAILNNRLAKAAMDAKAEIDRALKYIGKFTQERVDASKIGSDYMDRINELLSNYDVTKRFASKSDVEARQSMREWLAREESETGVAPEVSDALLDFTSKRSWKELSVEEFRGLVDSVKSLEHVGREKTQIVLDGKKQSLEDQVNQALAGTANLPHNEPIDIQPHLKHATGLDKINAQWLNFKSKVKGMDAAILKMEQVFQWLTFGRRAGLGESTTGPYLKLFQRAADAEGAERSMRAQATKEIRDLADALHDAKVDIHESLDLPGLQRPNRGTQWYREELLSAALNFGNKEGRRNLTDMERGNKFPEQALLQAFDKHFTDADWAFINGVHQIVGKYWPEIEALQKRMTGIGPTKVEALPFGKSTGGYHPIVFDAFIDKGAETREAKNTDALFENQFSRPTTNKGHTVARTGYVGPVSLSLDVISRHIDQVTHDLAWREAIIDMNKFLTHPKIQKDVDQVMGREYRKQFRPWLQAMANDKVFNTSGDSAWEGFVRKVRTNTTMVGLGFRLSTMLIHGGSAMSNSIGEIGTKWFAKGAAQFATPERWEQAKAFMYERSPEMANRFNEFDRNVREAIDDINAHQKSLGPISATQKAVDAGRRFALYGVQALDMGSAAPTWYGAYLKGMEKEANGGLGMSEKDAVEYANRAVRNAHGGGGVKDLAAIQRDKGVISLATMFYTYWNHMYNRQRDLAKGYANIGESFRQGTGTRDFARLLARSWWYFVIPQMIHATLKPSPQDQEDDGVSGVLKHYAEEIGLGFVGGVPVLRDLVNAALHGRDYTISPLQQAGEAIVKATTDTYKYATGEEPSAHAGKNAVQAAGYVFGLPTGQLSATGSFLWDVYDGDARPEDIKDWYTGIQNGKISE